MIATTLDLEFGRMRALPDTLWRAVRAAASRLRWPDLNGDAYRADPRTPEEVLDWACRIEATEPGYASDLRAAALRAMGLDDDAATGATGAEPLPAATARRPAPSAQRLDDARHAVTRLAAAQP